MGGEPIVARLASFNMTSMAYRPPPAIDEAQVEPDAPVPVETAQADFACDATGCGPVTIPDSGQTKSPARRA